MRRLALVVVCCLGATAAQAQTLTIQGDRFAIDGAPRFLTFISYFAAMSAPDVAADLHLLRTLGFDGVRIWPNLDTGPQLMNADGTLRPQELARLRTILSRSTFATALACWRTGFVPTSNPSGHLSAR